MKLNTIVLPLVLLLGLPTIAWSQLTFITNNGTITITGYTGSTSVLVIPSTTNGYPVTSITTNAFNGGNYFVDVTVPEGVTTIGDSAFWDCWYLSNVSLPNSLTKIGDFAFYLCSDLTNAPLGNSLTNIGAYAFSLTALISVILPESLLTIGEYGYSALR